MIAQKGFTNYITLVLFLFACFFPTKANAQKMSLTPQEQAWLTEHPNIRLGFNPNMEPLLIEGEDGSCEGIFPSIVDELEKTLGISISFEVDDWNLVVQKARKREIDGLLACAPSQAAASNLLKTQPIHKAYPVAFIRQDASFTINRLADLKEKSIAYQREVKMLEVVLSQLGNNNNVIAVNSTLEAIRLVLEGKIDVAFGINFENYLVAKHALSGIKLSYFDLEHSNPISTCIRNDWPEFIDIFNKGLNHIGKSRIQEILSEWTNIKDRSPKLELTPEEKAWLTEDHIVQVRITNFPPYIISIQGSTPKGIAVDYLKLIAEWTGIKFNYNSSGKTFSEALEGLKEHQGPDLISTMMSTPERQKTILFSKEFFKSPYVIFIRADDKRFVTDINDLADKKIAIVKGTVLHEMILRDYPNSNLVYFKNDIQAIEAVSNKQADAYIGNLTLASYHILDKGLYNIKLAAPSPFGDHVFSMGIRNDWPQLASIINKGLDSITLEEQTAIRNRYISLQYDQSNSAEIIQWILVVVGISLCIILLFIFWNRSLRKQVFSRTQDLLTEIEERKQAEEAVIASEAYLGKILNNIGDPVFVKDDQHRMVLVNDVFCSTFGLPRGDIIGKTLAENLPPDEMEHFLKIDRQVLTDGQENLCEESLTAKGGKTLTIITKKTRYVDENGDKLLIGVIRDITERKQAEEDKTNLEERLQQAQKMEAIGTLAGGIAHDFNNILGVILGYTDMAKEDAPPGTHYEKDLKNVYTAANRAKDLVKQILAFSRQAQVEKFPLKLQFLIKEGLKMLRSSIPATISITENIAPKSGLVLADPTQIHQILMNLCTNAYHAMETTGGELSVTLNTTFIKSDDQKMLVHLTPGEYVEVTVSDNGGGIGPDVVGKIFDPYFTTKEIGKGTGMGLAIIHGIMQEYGGAITVESQLGTGSTFHVYFPVVKEDAVPERKEQEDIPRGKERVLFIDDEELLAEMGQDMLERLGYHVTVRRSSLEALSTFQNSPGEFDLVITDQTMPDMTGSDLARRMMQIKPDIPIILCTGYSNLIDEDSAKALGIKEFALKPLTKGVIAKLIRKVMNGTV